MAIADEKLISVLITEDAELKKHVEKHRELDYKICLLSKRRYRTPDEEIERKTLQKQKLAGKDKIQNILFKYKKNERVIF